MLTTKQIITLVNKGFTEEEILSFDAETLQTTIEVKKVEQAEAPKDSKEQEVSKAKDNAGNDKKSVDESIEKLAQLINSSKANIDIPPTATVEEQLAEHFKSLIGG